MLKFYSLILKNVRFCLYFAEFHISTVTSSKTHVNMEITVGCHCTVNPSCFLKYCIRQNMNRHLICNFFDFV